MDKNLNRLKSSRPFTAIQIVWGLIPKLKLFKMDVFMITMKTESFRQMFLQGIKSEPCVVKCSLSGFKKFQILTNLIHNKPWNLFKDPSFRPDAFDGMPLVFSEKLTQTPDPTIFKITLSNGEITYPECVTLAPANEDNESNTRET